MSYRLINTVASVFTAIGTVAVSVLAIWGDRVKDYILGPRLALSLVSAGGDLTTRNTGGRIYYYHLRVVNGKRRIPAHGVRVVVQGLSQRTPGGIFVQHPVVYPLQLSWTPAEPGEVERTIVHDSTCDFGFIDQEGDIRPFCPAIPRVPNNFPGFVAKDECVRFEVVATGQNVFSPRPTVFEVSWDGQWTENQEEMKRHLVIREVPSLR